MTELVLTAVRGDELEDFEGVVRRYERQVLGTALRLLGSLPDAQDASQEVFLRLYRNRGRLEDPAECGAWLYRVTVNVCRDLRRRRPAAEVPGELGEVAGTAADALSQLEESERHRALALLLRRLPEKERAAVVLRDLEGLSTREVASILGSSEATVRSQVSQGRLRLREALQRYFGGRG